MKKKTSLITSPIILLTVDLYFPEYNIALQIYGVNGEILLYVKKIYVKKFKKILIVCL